MSTNAATSRLARRLFTVSKAMPWVAVIAALAFASTHVGNAQDTKKPAPKQETSVPAQSQSAATSAPATHELTAADLEPFLDGLMPAQLERENIAGAVISVVKDGKLIFAKGYGYSDM